MLTREREGYYENFAGTPNELADTLEHGWLDRGQRKRADGKTRGGESTEFPPEQFVYCISNHDQVGNRAFGERLGHIIEPAAYRAASALICLVPYTPMLFMGQEWNASTPFQFFTDHNTELGKLVTQGRRKEFEHFSAFRDPEMRKTIPDPQSDKTFANSKLRWDEAREPERAGIIVLYREFLRLRKTHLALQDRSRENWRVEKSEDGIVWLEFGREKEARVLVAIDLIGGHSAPDRVRNSKLILSSNDRRFANDSATNFAAPTVAVYELA